MNQDMKQTAGWLVFGTLAIIVIWAVFSALYPAQLSFQRNAVEQSKSFTDSQNAQMVNSIQDYVRLDTKIVEAAGNDQLIASYKGQQRADKNSICKSIALMQPGTVSQDVLRWVAQTGGCLGALTY